MRPFVNTGSLWNVVFNFTGTPIHDLTAFALGYQRAARALTKQFLKTRRPDYEGYPILYLYRHSLELYLKAVVYKGAMLMKLLDEGLPEIKIFEDHQLHRLIPSVRVIFTRMGWNFDFEASPFASFEEFEKFIRDIDSIDKNSYAFRYPITKSRKPNVPRHLTIDLVAFSETSDAALGILDGAVELLNENLDAILDEAFEVRQYLQRSNHP